MASSPNYLDPETLSELKDLRLRANSIVDGLVTGMHRSPFHGYSVEFAQHREYTPGDDVRHVDWKVFARTDKLHLKQFEDETNLCCWVLVDQSESMQFASPNAPLSKYDYCSCLAVAIAWLVLNQRDEIGLMLFADEIQSTGRPSDRQESLIEVVRTLQQSAHPHSTSFGNSLTSFAREIARRGIVVVLSDCFDEFESLAAGLEAVRRRDHQVLLVQVLDPVELTFDFGQAVQLNGMENGVSALVDPLKLKSVYQQVVTDQTRKLAEFCQKQSIFYEQVSSARNLSLALTGIMNRFSSGRRSR